MLDLVNHKGKAERSGAKFFAPSMPTFVLSDLGFQILKTSSLSHVILALV